MELHVCIGNGLARFFVARELLRPVFHIDLLFAPLEFLPHCYAHEAIAAQTPILLTSESSRPPTHQVLVNLDDNWPPFFSEFERLIEIVANDDIDRSLGRARYKFYRDRGYALNNFDLSAP